MSVVIGTRLRMKLYITKYMCANVPPFVVNIPDMPDYRHSGRPF